MLKGSYYANPLQDVPTSDSSEMQRYITPVSVVCVYKLFGLFGVMYNMNDLFLSSIIRYFSSCFLPRFIM